jgi:hypothetical protein
MEGQRIEEDVRDFSHLYYIIVRQLNIMHVCICMDVTKEMNFLYYVCTMRYKAYFQNITYIHYYYAVTYIPLLRKLWDID